MISLEISLKEGNKVEALSVLRSRVGKRAYQSIPQYQSGGAGTWSQDQFHSCVELSEKYILQSIYSTVAYERNKRDLSKGNQTVTSRTILDQEKLTALTIKRIKDKYSEKSSDEADRAPLLC